MSKSAGLRKRADAPPTTAGLDLPPAFARRPPNAPDYVAPNLGDPNDPDAAYTEPRAPRPGMLIGLCVGIAVSLTLYLVVFYETISTPSDAAGFTADGINLLDVTRLTLVHNVTVRTMDPKVPDGAALLVRGNEIARVIHANDAAYTLQSLRGTGVTVVNGHGAYVYPGLMDSHGHFLGHGLALSRPNLVGLSSVAAVRTALRDFIAQSPDGSYSDTRWLVGSGWDHTTWTDARDGAGAFPIARDLDSDPVLASIPIVLQRIDVHAYWLNQRAITLLGQLPLDVAGGAIKRDPTTGLPAGVFVDNAMFLVDNVMPAPVDADWDAALTRAQTDLVRFGVTAVGDAGVLPPAMAALVRGAQSGELKVRVHAMISCPQDAQHQHIQAPAPAFCAETVQGLVEAARNVSDRVAIRSVKLFLDGALGSHGAALIRPYDDAPETRGIVRCSSWECPELNEVVRKWDAAGFQVNIHAIGDHANRLAINALEQVKAEKRPRIEHAQILTLEDIDRVAKLGILPSMQPTHATSDMGYAQSRLGLDRLRGAYAWQRFLQAGVTHLPLSSDFPVESPDPLEGMYSAIARMDHDAKSPHGDQTPWFADQALTPYQAVKGFTSDAAYASFMDTIIGTIAPGKRADLVFTGVDLAHVTNAQELLPKGGKQRVLATWIDGECVYEKDAWCARGVEAQI
ncbi:hypothetical protein GGF32_001500 [Allomyces javanicus]|nr:hypothetical protein GGF32_001500 [Allomyces javanicus]